MWVEKKKKDDSNEYKMKYGNCHVDTPQLEQRVSKAVSGLTASMWPSANKQEVTLSFPKLHHT